MASGDTENAANSPESAAPAAFSLETILNDDSETLEHPDFKGEPEKGWDEESTERAASEGFCIECEGESPLPPPWLCTP